MSVLIPAAGYLRRSSDNPSQETSLPDQRSAIERFAKLKGYRIVRWYTDDAISGDELEKRPGFLQMHTDAQQLGDFKVILCWDRARFGRFDSITYGYVVHPLRKAGVCLVTVVEGLTDWTALEGRIVAGVMQESRHQFLVDLAANVVRGQTEAALKGSWVGGPPYGYVIQGGKKAKRLALGDAVKVAIVRRIFHEYTEEGRACNAIARRLNEEGHPSPSGKPGGWWHDGVQCILSNPCYTGD
jgi:site-specific DNA recombinase